MTTAARATPRPPATRAPRVVALDLETWPIRPRLQAPPPACVQIAGDLPEITEPDHYVAERSGVVVATVRSPWFARCVRWALSAETLVVTNGRFDLLVLFEHGYLTAIELFALLDRGPGGVVDVSLREQLIDIARGILHTKGRKYDLGSIAQRRGQSADKASEWRLKYGQLASVPVEQWPSGAREYAENDARILIPVGQDQERSAAQLSSELGGDVLADQDARFRASVALGLVAAHGVSCDPVVTSTWRRERDEALAKAREVLRREGLAYVGRDAKWHRRQKMIREHVEALWTKRGVREYPRTKSGKFPEVVPAVANTLEDPVVDAWCAYSGLATEGDRLTTCEAASGSEPIHTNFGLAESGRSTSSADNVQNWARKGRHRECLAPRPTSGRRNVLLAIDHDGLELSTFAQVLVKVVGYSRLADALNARPARDPHAIVAGQLLGCDESEVNARRAAGDKVADETRQVGKMGNFSFGGGGGVRTFCANALRKYETYVPEEHSHAGDQCGHCIKQAFLDAWPETREYFRIMGAMPDRATVRHLFSGRFRGRCGYTDRCNTMFQGLGADLTADVLYELQRTCYGAEVTALTGCRVENYVHDEYLVAVPDDEHLEKRATTLEAIVTGVAALWLPDLSPGATAVATARWSKRARRATDEHGRLVVWEYDPLVEAIWTVGAAVDEARAARAAKLGEVGEAAARVLGERPWSEVERRALDAAMLRETQTYEGFAGEDRARWLAEWVLDTNGKTR